MKYRLKSPEVEGFHYQQEQLNQLPEWAKAFRGQHPLNGATSIARNPVGNLLVPTYEAFAECRPGEWLVFDGKSITVMRPKEFDSLYEAVPEEVPVIAFNQVDAPEIAAPPMTEAAPTIVPQPVAEPVPVVDFIQDQVEDRA